MKLTYAEWFAKVNAALIYLTGFNTDDLPDYDYSGAYAAGRTPVYTALRVIRAAKDY